MDRTPGQRREYRFTAPGDAEVSSELREVVDRIGASEELGEAERFDLQLAMTEALTNAVKHSDDGAEIVVIILFGGREIEIQVENQGSFEVNPLSDVEHGRGMPLMVTLLDEVTFSSRKGQDETQVRLVKRVSVSAAATV